MKKKIISVLLIGLVVLNLTECGAMRGIAKEISAKKNAEQSSSNNINTTDTETKNPKEFLDEIEGKTKSKDLQMKDVTDKDGSLQISIPITWNNLEEVKSSNPDFCLGVGNIVDETYAGIMYENKQDLSSNISLDKYTDLVTKNLGTTITNITIADMQDVDINGQKAKTFTVKGEVNSIKVTYLYSIIDLPNTYANVITWTLTTRFDKNKDKLTKIINSFKELKSN